MISIDYIAEEEGASQLGVNRGHILDLGNDSPY